MQPLTGVILATRQSYGAPDAHVNIKQTVCQRALQNTSYFSTFSNDDPAVSSQRSDRWHACC
jgi:hypothetical protein